MFDIGFFELLLVGVIALLVIGPERLPKVAHTAGLWFGRARRTVMDVKADIDRELKAEELKRILDEQARSTGIHEIIEETRESVDKLKGEVTTIDPAAEADSSANAGDSPKSGSDKS